MSARDGSGNERRSARGRSGAEGELPRYGQLHERIIRSVRGDAGRSQSGDEQGRKFESDLVVQRRDGHTLKRGLVLRSFDDGAGVGGAFIFVMCCRGFLVLAAGEKLEFGSGF